MAPGFRDFSPWSLGSAVSMTVCGEAGWRERKGGEGRGEGGREGEGNRDATSLFL